MRPGAPALGAIFGLALAVRLLHLWQVSAAPFFGLKIVDAAVYDAWARRIAAGDWIGEGVFYQAPLYPYFLGAVYGLVGDGALQLLILQSLIGASACVLLAGAGARFFSERAGIVAGLLLAFYVPAVFFDTLVQKSVLDLFLVCLLLRILSGVSDAPGRASLLGAGAVLGTLVLTRENALILVPAILFWLCVRGDLRPRIRLELVAALLVGLGAVLAPVALRNLVVGGEFHLTTSQLGPNLYIGNNAEATGTYEPLVWGRGHPDFERIDATRMAEEALGRTLSPAEVSRYWTARAVDYATGDPLGWLGLMSRKFALAWNATEAADAEDPYTYAEWSLPLRWGGWLFHFGVLAPLAFAGMWISWRERSRHWLLYLLLFSYLGTVVLFFVFARYRFPMVPVLALFAGAGLVAAPDFVAAANWRGRALLLTATAGVAVFCNWPLADRDQLRAFTHHNFGLALKAQGRTQEAIFEHRRSVALNPGLALFHNKLGHVLFRAGDHEEAAGEFRAAVALDASYTEAHYNLGTALAERGDFENASAAFREAIRLQPDHPKAHYNLANALLAQDRWEAAALGFQEAIRIDPASAPALYNLGLLRARQGRLEEARQWLEAALAASPGFEAARAQLERVRKVLDAPGP